MEINGTIDEFIRENGFSARLGVIDLGWENGWGVKTYNVLTELRKYRVEGSQSTSGSSASWRVTKFTVRKDGEEYTVVYSTDSGD